MSASFWQTVATYCNHLAPVAGPLLGITSNTAAAIHNAECETRALSRDSAYLGTLLSASPDQDPPAALAQPKPRRRRKRAS